MIHRLLPPPLTNPTNKADIESFLASFISFQEATKARDIGPSFGSFISRSKRHVKTRDINPFPGPFHFIQRPNKARTSNPPLPLSFHSKRPNKARDIESFPFASFILFQESIKLGTSSPSFCLFHFIQRPNKSLDIDPSPLPLSFHSKIQQKPPRKLRPMAIRDYYL